ncbi:unnamed protein product, partial [Phaeothamnion confervicola]
GRGPDSDKGGDGWTIDWVGAQSASQVGTVLSFLIQLYSPTTFGRPGLSGCLFLDLCSYLFIALQHSFTTVLNCDTQQFLICYLPSSFLVPQLALDCYVDPAKGLYRLSILPRLAAVLRAYVESSRLAVAASDASDGSAVAAVATSKGGGRAAVWAEAGCACLQVLQVLARRSKFLASEITMQPSLLDSVREASAICMHAWSLIRSALCS